MTEEDLEILKAVKRELKRTDDGNAPGHGHMVVGILDNGNGYLSGQPCAWCLCWKKFTNLIENKGQE